MPSEANPLAPPWSPYRTQMRWTVRITVVVPSCMWSTEVPVGKTESEGQQVEIGKAISQRQDKLEFDGPAKSGSWYRSFCSKSKPVSSLQPQETHHSSYFAPRVSRFPLHTASRDPPRPCALVARHAISLAVGAGKAADLLASYFGAPFGYVGRERGWTASRTIVTVIHLGRSVWPT